MFVMQNEDPKPTTNLKANVSSQLDLEAINEHIWNDLGRTVSRSDIRRVLLEVAPKYERARIMTYVPILLYRDVRRRLEG